jgi:ubiquinone/menaquinone biosynthesis C-methylase UbiE
MGVPRRGEGLRLLDLGCGTGASTAALLSVAPLAEIVGVDGSAGMIAHARRKVWPDNVRFVHSRLEEIREKGPFDGILAAYLIRNLPDPDSGLRTLHDLLAPGARLAVHDYSVADSRRARAIWTAVCWSVIIPSGAVVTRRPGLYRYLWESVREFDGARAFQDRLRRAGFADVEAHTMPGWQRNVVHTFLARRPTPTC